MRPDKRVNPPARPVTTLAEVSWGTLVCGGVGCWWWPSDILRSGQGEAGPARS
jgi:hypothetical protein